MASFGVTFGSYSFTHIETFSDNFADAVTRTIRLPGLSGGFDLYGTDPAASEIGTVNITFTLVAAARADMQAAIDAVRALYRSGVTTLTLQPEGTANPRWCYARVNNISIPRRPGEHSDLFQKVSISFQVADPHWYENIANTSVSASGTSTNKTVTITGNDIALAKVTIVTDGSHTCEDPEIQRLVGADIIDTVSYTGLVGTSKTLTINALLKTVTLTGASDCYAGLDYAHPDWLRLYPGDNTCKVLFANAGDEATVTFYWYPTYR